MSNINYNQKEKYRLTSAYSIENRTTSSSHFNRTQRLIKELKTFILVVVEAETIQQQHLLHFIKPNLLLIIFITKH